MNDNNNANEYENESLSTITSIGTPYTESIVSEKISENTWSSSRVDKLKLRSLGQTSSETSTSEKSIDSETVVSEQNSVNTLSSSGLEEMHFSSTTSSETMSKKSVDPEGWKGIPEYEDFWKAWENGLDIEKIDMSINKIQDVFEKVHLPEPPLPTKPIGTDAIPVENNNAKTRVLNATATQPSGKNGIPGIIDNKNDQFQDDSYDDEVSPDSTDEEFDEDVLTENSCNSYIDDPAQTDDIAAVLSKIMRI